MPNSATDLVEIVRKLPAMQMRGSFVPESFDTSGQTVRLLYTDGTAAVRNWDPSFGEYNEILSVQPGHVRLGRLNGGAPLLNSHQRDDLKHVIGVIERGSATETEATARFSDDAESAVTARKVETGIVQNCSVGYFVYRYQEITQPGDEVRTLLAVDWEPFEISMVAVGADAVAGVRSKQLTSTCTILAARAAENTEGTTMPTTKIETPVTEPAAPAAAPAVTEAARAAEIAEATRQGVIAENQRQSQITALVRSAKLPDAFATPFIADTTKTIENVRAAVLDKLVADEAEEPTNPRVRINNDTRAERMEAIELALMHRAEPGKNKLTAQARSYRGMRLTDIAKEELEISGEFERGMSQSQIAERSMNSTSDFPNILANVAHKTLRQSYEKINRTFLPFCRETTIPDFKPISRTALSEAPNLDKIDQGGEYKRGTLVDGAETYQLFTYGKILAFTRETIINDDLDALTRVPAMFGAAAARLESDLVYSILTGNPNMADGNALFSGAHANNLTSFLTIAGLGQMRAAMRLQKGLAGQALANIAPTYLIVPAALELTALQMLYPIDPTTQAAANPYRDQFQVITEARLDAASTVNYFTAADPSEIDTIEYAYLEGESGPYIESRNGFTRDGLEIKIRHDFAAKAIDWKGLQKSSNSA